MNFDIERYTATTAKLEYDDIDFDAFRDQPLDEASLRCLRYMHDVEYHTICYLRDLLVTRVHGDTEITTFLTFWAFEEYWHGEAIAKVLATHDEVSGAERVALTRETLPKWDRARPLGSMAISAVFKHFAAVHMSWGAVNEWTTQAGYSRLIAKAEHPVLTELLRRIMKQEGRHIDFYASQASRHLEASRRARWLTRKLLLHTWGPVGSGVMPKEEVAFLTQHLFGGEDGIKAAKRIDRNIDRLPGLAGMDLLVGAVEKHHTAPAAYSVAAAS